VATGQLPDFYLLRKKMKMFAQQEAARDQPQQHWKNPLMNECCIMKPEGQILLTLNKFLKILSSFKIEK
jgi:hypothetical protein